MNNFSDVIVSEKLKFDDSPIFDWQSHFPSKSDYRVLWKRILVSCKFCKAFKALFATNHNLRAYLFCSFYNCMWLKFRSNMIPISLWVDIYTACRPTYCEHCVYRFLEHVFLPRETQMKTFFWNCTVFMYRISWIVICPIHLKISKVLERWKEPCRSFWTWFS